MEIREFAGGAGQARVAPLIELHPSVRVTKSGLLFTKAPSLSSWEDIGRRVTSVVNSSTWWIADWLVYGESMFGDRYLEAIEKTSLRYQTLRNYAWVARRFDHSRRRDALSFGHHSEVAVLEIPEQDYWLRKAEELSWSRNQLRKQVRASLRQRDDPSVAPSGSGASGKPCPSDGETWPRLAFERNLSLVLTAHQIALFERTAVACNMELHEWALSILEGAARNENSA
jgi:hypothetical protein